MANPLGISLGSVFTDQLQIPNTPPAPQFNKGQMLAGILADALAGAMGKPGQFAQMQQQQRQNEQEDAQWSRRQSSVLQNQMALDDYKRLHPDPSPMERDASAGMGMNDAQREAYREAQAAKPQFIPDGMGGGRWAAPPASPAGPPANITFTPIPGDGGPTLGASGGFPTSYPNIGPYKRY